MIEKCGQLTMYVSFQVMSDLNTSDCVNRTKRSRIIPASTQATVIPSIKLVEETPIWPSEDERSDYMNINSCYPACIHNQY